MLTNAAAAAGSKKVSTKIPLSKLAAWLDCSGTRERRRGPPGGHQ